MNNNKELKLKKSSSITVLTVNNDNGSNGDIKEFYCPCKINSNIETLQFSYTILCKCKLTVSFTF